MVESYPPSHNPTPRIEDIFQPYLTKHYRDKCYPGLSFEQGKRSMIQINVPAADLPTLMQAKPSQGNDPDSGKNRPEVKGHVEEVKSYILKRAKKDKPWILGTLTANVSPKEITVIEFGIGVCLVIIPSGIKLDITDGQHRKRAIHELVESAEGHLVARNQFPITLVLEDDFQQCQADFRDMAQTKSLDKALLLSFGEFEGQVGITKNLIAQVSMFKDKTERIKNSPSTKQKLIYTTNYLARFVSFALINDPNNELNEYDVEQASTALVTCLNGFFSECEQTRYISETSVDNLTANDIDKFKENCILGRSVGIEILGRLLYCTYDKNEVEFDYEKVSQLANLDWRRESELWKANIVLSNSNLNYSNKAYKISNTASAVKMAI